MNTIKRYFNMVEVALAMAVVGLGIAGIMSLFPVGLNASRDAIGDNYSSDAANDFVQFIVLYAHVQDQWSVLTGFPVSKPDGSGASEGVSPDLSGSWTPITLPGYEHIYVHNTVPGLYRIYQGKNVPTNTDFRGAVRIWQSDVKTSVNDGTWKTWIVPKSHAIGLNIEISWPVERPYEQRSKRFIYTEVYKNM